MYFTQCASCGDTLCATYTGQESHPACPQTESEKLARQFVDAVQRGDSTEADRLEKLVNKIDEPPALGSAALWYASVGWSVFPLRPGQKVPATRRGFHDATVSEHQIREWWGAEPSFNIGVATGHHFEVLDIDGPEGFKSIASVQDKVPDVHGRVGTPRGEHLLIRPEGNGNRAGVLPGLDVRGLGGYVVCPPSIVDGKRYVWLMRPSPEILAPQEVKV